MDLVKLGSQTAKKGFKNEGDIIEKFNNWRTDIEAQKWLTIMQYDLKEIEDVQAIKIIGHKTDVQVQVIIKTTKAIDVQNLQIKLVSNRKGFNQVDKRWVDKYVEMWGIPKNISKSLKLYTGELKSNIKNPRDARRMFADEFSKKDQALVISWLEKNKSLIVSDILKGRGRFSAEWILVTQKINEKSKWILIAMNYCLNFFGNGEVKITKRGNFRIGRITMQRKGGDSGRITSHMLQFKINPSELFSF